MSFFNTSFLSKLRVLSYICTRKRNNEIKGNHIIVKFDNLPDNKTFQFPNIFTQLRKMTTENKKLLHRWLFPGGFVCIMERLSDRCICRRGCGIPLHLVSGFHRLYERTCASYRSCLSQPGRQGRKNQESGYVHSGQMYKGSL